MIKEKVFYVGEDGAKHTFQEEVSCKPTNFREEDIIHAAFMLAVGRFASEYDKRIADPGCEAELEDVDLDGWSIEGNLPLNFPKVTILKGYTDIIIKESPIKSFRPTERKSTYNWPINYYLTTENDEVKRKRL